jgi:hypothetical protein
MPTTTNYGWTTPADTDLVKDGASAIRTLGTSIDTTTKNLNPSTTLGDIEYRSSTANTNTRLGIGSSGQVLTVSGGVPAWTTISSGGMTLISEQVASANTAIDFTSISQDYKQLLLVWSGIKHSGTSGGFGLRFNSSSSSVYNEQGLYVDGSSAGNDFAQRTNAGDDAFGFRANSTDLGAQANGWLYIDNYASTTKFKAYNLRFSYRDGGSSTNRSYTYVGTFADTTAITSVNIFRRSGTDTITNTTNTSIRLYGLS